MQDLPFFLRNIFQENPHVAYLHGWKEKLGWGTHLDTFYPMGHLRNEHCFLSPTFHFLLILLQFLYKLPLPLVDSRLLRDSGTRADFLMTPGVLVESLAVSLGSAAR